MFVVVVVIVRVGVVIGVGVVGAVMIMVASSGYFKKAILECEKEVLLYRIN